MFSFFPLCKCCHSKVAVAMESWRAPQCSLSKLGNCGREVRWCTGSRGISHVLFEAFETVGASGHIFTSHTVEGTFHRAICYLLNPVCLPPSHILKVLDLSITISHTPFPPSCPLTQHSPFPATKCTGYRPHLVQAKGGGRNESFHDRRGTYLRLL